MFLHLSVSFYGENFRRMNQSYIKMDTQAFDQCDPGGQLCIYSNMNVLWLKWSCCISLTPAELAVLAASILPVKSINTNHLQKASAPIYSHVSSGTRNSVDTIYMNPCGSQTSIWICSLSFQHAV